MNKLIIYCLFILIGSSCILSKKKSSEDLKSSFASNSILGDTTYDLWNKECEYIVEDISKKIQFPDSLLYKTFSQNPRAGDTMKREYNIPISLFFEDESGIDTFYYQVNLRCGTSDIPQFISICKDGNSNTWEIPELRKYPNNTTRLYDRHGKLVFQEKGYFTGYCGKSNTEYGKSIANKKGYLPEATYYYIIDLGESDIEPFLGYVQIKH